MMKNATPGAPNMPPSFGPGTPMVRNGPAQPILSPARPLPNQPMSGDVMASPGIAARRPMAPGMGGIRPPMGMNRMAGMGGGSGMRSIE